MHPSYLSACSESAAEVETAGYLMPYGRSALSVGGLMMPLLHPGRDNERPFEGKTIILCVSEEAAATGETTLENWLFVFEVAGATVKVVRDDHGGDSVVRADSSAAVAKDLGSDNRCTPQGARRLLAEGRVHCVIGPSMDGAAPQATTSTAAAAAVLQAAVNAGTPTGTLEWAAQCMAHGRFLLPSADTCAWFPVHVAAAAGGPTGRTTSTPREIGSGGGGGGGERKTEAGSSASETSGGGA